MSAAAHYWPHIRATLRMAIGHAHGVKNPEIEQTLLGAAAIELARETITTIAAARGVSPALVAKALADEIVRDADEFTVRDAIGAIDNVFDEIAGKAVKP